jgi:hypothetical protein
MCLSIALHSNPTSLNPDFDCLFCPVTMPSMQVGMYATSRIIAAVSRAHLLPPFLARVHHKLGTPYISTILSGMAAAVMALFTGEGCCYCHALGFWNVRSFSCGYPSAVKVSVHISANHVTHQDSCEGWLGWMHKLKGLVGDE